MQNARQGIIYLASFVGAWLLISFGGAMFDSANAALWSNSLMWAVLAFMVVSPALVFLSTPSEEASRSTARRKDFVDNESEEDRRLWPKSEQNADSNETKQSVRAGA